MTSRERGPILEIMTKVPVIHIEQGAGLKLWCQHCDLTMKPKREFLSEWRDTRYESARCTACGKEIAGIVVKNKRGVGPDEEFRERRGCSSAGLVPA